jgi:hypothetical protein
LPRTPDTIVHVLLTAMATSTMVFLSTTNPGDGGSSVKPMGSFVYAMPDVGCPCFLFGMGSSIIRPFYPFFFSEDIFPS